LEKSVKNNASKPTTLKCVKTAGGKYGLYSAMPDGKLKRVSKIGLGAKPYEIVAEYPNRNLVAVKKYAKTPHGIMPQLFLVNTQTGKIPDIMRDGVVEIMYDAEKQNFYFDSMLNTMDIAEYIKLMVMLLTAPYHQLNESHPSKVPAPRIQILTAQMPGKAITIVAMPTRRKKRARKKVFKRARAKRINTIKAQQKTITPKTKTVAGTNKRRRMGNAKPAMRAQFIAPYSLRQNPRIKYGAARINSTKPKSRSMHNGMRPASMPVLMPVPMNMIPQNQR